MYFDITFTFLFMLIPALSLKQTPRLSPIKTFNLVRTIQHRHMSPFILYLYLKPLYSMRGGSTTRADPFIKRPSLVLRRKDPLYK
jgi:hypothetical protein